MKKIKHLGTSLLSLVLAFSMVFSALMLPDIMHINDTKEASAATVSSVMGTNGYISGVNLTAGATYTFGGYNWVCAETSGNLAVLQSTTGVTAGKWAGYTMSGTLTNAAGSTIDVGSADTYYAGNIDGYDISNYNSTTQSLYSSIKAAEYTSATYGKGLYLVSETYGSGYYWEALKSAANNYKSFESNQLTFVNAYVYTGTYYNDIYTGDNKAYVVGANGVFTTIGQTGVCVIAPAFNLDTSKVRLSGTTLEILQQSTGINATQSITSVEEGATTDLASVITAVKYVDGDNAGKSASYTISTNEGSISGTKWTAPTVNTNKSVELTITEQGSGKNLSTTKTVTVTPKASKRIAVEKNETFPEYISTGNTVDIAPCINVKGYDTSDSEDGVISDYTITTDEPTITINGTKISVNDNFGTNDIVFTLTATGSAGSVDYSGKQTTFTLTTKSDLGSGDRTSGEDENGFREYKDNVTGITWKYRFDSKGYIRYIYTADNPGGNEEEDIKGIISDSKALIVPTSINGVSVIGIGGGADADGNIIPFVPTEGENVNDTWKSIYIPKSIKYINDGAFYNAKTKDAEIVISNNVMEIGARAFKKSNIYSVVFDTNNSLTIKSEAFAEISNLKNITIRGNVTIGQKAFAYDKKVKELVIPDGVTFNGASGEDNSYAFLGMEGLETLKISTEIVNANTFSETKSLRKVIFDKSVIRVDNNWCGTASSNETTANTVDRTVYVLSENTLFEIDKTNSVSPFGYAGNVTVVGKTSQPKTNDFSSEADLIVTKIPYLSYYSNKSNFAKENDQDKAKDGYEEQYNFADTLKTYAKGTAASITIQTEGNPAENNEVTSIIPAAQDGIEASYTGIIFGGRKLEKEKASVYQMFGTKQGEAYATDDFYIVRSGEVSKLLKPSPNGYTWDEEKAKDNIYVAKTPEYVTNNFASSDNITVNDEDVANGVIDVTVVVLKKTEDGDILLNNDGAVKAYTYTLAIPVKQYTAEDDFFENYGSYGAVISKINELNKSVTDLTAELELKEQKIAELQVEADRLEAENERITNELNEAKAEVDRLTKELAESKKQIAVYTSNYAELTGILKQYAKNLKLDETGYLGTLTSNDTTQKVVYVGVNMYAYEETEDAVVYESKQYPVYLGHDNTTDGNESRDFYFIATESGVIILTKDVADDSVTYHTGTVYTDTAAATQRKANALTLAIGKQLADMNQQITDYEATLAAIQNKITELKGALGIKDDEMDGKTEAEQLDIILNKVLALNNQITSYDSVVKSVYKQLMSEDLTNEQLTDINNVLQAMTSKITELKDTNQKLTDDVASRDETIKDLNDKLNQSEDSVENLTTQLEQMKADAAALDKTVKEQAQTIAEAKDKVTELETQNGNLETEIGSLNDNITKLEQNNRDQSEQISNLQTTLSSKDTEIADNTATIEDLKKVIEQAKEEAAALKEKNASQQKTIDSLRENVENLTNIKDEQAAQITALKADLNTLTGQNTALQEKVTSLTATVKEQEQTIAELKRLLAAQKEAVEKLEKESEQYLLTTDEAVKLFGLDANMSKEEMKAAINGFVTAKTTISKIQSAFATDKDGDELVTFLQAKTSTNVSAPSAPSTPSTSSTADYASGFKDGYNAAQSSGSNSNNTDNSTSAYLQSQNTTLTKENKTLADENKDLTTQLNTLTNGIDDLYDAIPSDGLVGASSVNDTMKKLGAVKTALVSMETNRKNLGKRNTTLAKKVTSLNKTNKSLTANNKSLKKANSSLKSKNSKLTAKNKSLATANKSLESTNNTLRVSLRNAQSVKTPAAKTPAANSSVSNGTVALTSKASQKEKKEKDEKKEDNSSKSSKSESTEITKVAESTESTESTETKDEENIPSLSDKVNETEPIYEIPKIGGDDGTEASGNGLDDTECVEPSPIELNDSDSSLPIGPIVFGVIIIVGVAVLLMKKKKAKADVDDI